MAGEWFAGLEQGGGFKIKSAEENKGTVALGFFELQAGTETCSSAI